jgi:hypothetical protein
VTTPELLGDHRVPGRAGYLARRRHAEVWHALHALLVDANVHPHNTRVGRLGPDLLTKKRPRVLFEIKSEGDAQSIQTGIGQLFLYSQLLDNGPLVKVLVLPHKPRHEIAVAIEALGIRCLFYRRLRSRVQMDPKGLQLVLRG